MRAQIVYFTAPGKCEIREWDCPDPGPGQVQVHCVANGICMGDTALFTGKRRTEYPCRIGHEGVGVVTKAAPGVTNLREGDYVDCYGWSSYQNVGALRVNRFAAPPGDPAIYLIEPAHCVVTALYSYNVTPGDRVLMTGAGYMGLLNVQGLAACPLQDLVVTNVKPQNLELARRFGATEVIQVGTAEGDARMEALLQEPFDLVIEASAAASALQKAGDYCRHGGRLSIFSWHHEPRLIDLGLWHMKGLAVLNSAPGIGADHKINSMSRALRLLERGVFDMSQLVTHRHPVSDVQKAMELSVERPAGYIKGVLLFGK